MNILERLMKMDPSEVRAILITDEEEDGFGVDPVEADRAVTKFFDVVAMISEEPKPDDIAEYIYDNFAPHSGWIKL